METADRDLQGLVSAIEACHGAEELVAEAGSILARHARLRELWWIDAPQGVLYSRAGGILPLEERPLAELDAGAAGLARAAIHAREIVQLEGEVAGPSGEVVKVALLALPLWQDDRLLGVLGLLTSAPGGFPAALASRLSRLSEPLARAAERVSLRAGAERMEAELRRAQSFSALGRLAAAVAHEIRNPLAAMTHAITLLRANPALGDDDQSLFEILLEELARVNRIVTDFLAFSKPSAGRFAPADVAHLVDGAVRLLRRDPCVGAAIALDTEIPPDLPSVRLDADKIRQVLWNLCLNAAQAIPPGGRITIRAHALREATRDGVCVEVSDDGPGIAPELRERAFQPFETTRVNGTGLGLALARHSITLHDGWIRIESAPGGGACIRFWLPVNGPDALRDAPDEE